MVTVSLVTTMDHQSYLIHIVRHHISTSKVEPNETNHNIYDTYIRTRSDVQ